jgi:hypothetical protein
MINCGFDARSCQCKCYEIGMCCFSVKQAALRRKSTQMQDNVLIQNQDLITITGLYHYLCITLYHYLTNMICVKWAIQG